ncbi:YecA family protein [Flammeovirga sp. EKP202]|uniref:YecA family protein n=1 Tax=Flammeovirga sp. EKP202 TaxID=2770592 RepID=UPI001CB7B4C3|nr:SEC-C metal-binding domain-containing protein [Flammeovirga sp. EKP202]
MAPERGKDLLLKVFTQSEEFLDFYLLDEVIDFYGVCYKMLNNDLALVKDYLLSPLHSSFAKSTMVRGMCAISVYQPERRQELLHFMDEVLHEYLTSTDSNVIDPSLNAMILGEIEDANLHELEPYIKKLYDADRIDKSFCGNYEEYQIFSEGFALNENNYTINVVKVTYLELEETYNPDERMFDLSGLEEELDFEDEEAEEIMNAYLYEKSLSKEPKVGRNDPCPCGSGKKYKKCCM